jgi:DNA repair ATPase RecN
LITNINEVENLRIERDNIRTLAESRKSEVERLEEKLQQASVEYTDRCKQISFSASEKIRESLKKLEEEVRTLSVENGKLKVLIERAEREKK